MSEIFQSAVFVFQITMADFEKALHLFNEIQVLFKKPYLDPANLKGVSDIGFMAVTAKDRDTEELLRKLAQLIY